MVTCTVIACIQNIHNLYYSYYQNVDLCLHAFASCYQKFSSGQDQMVLLLHLFSGPLSYSNPHMHKGQAFE